MPEEIKITEEELKKAAQEYCDQQRHEDSVEQILCKADFKSGARWAIEYIKNQLNVNNSSI